MTRFHHLYWLAAGLVALPVWGAGIQAPGVPNFHQVNATIYRGAQPTREGWESLSKLGVTMVIDLRREREDREHFTNAEQRAVEAAGMRYINVPMNGIVAPSDAQVAKVLAVFDSGQKVFVHCRQGKDRTGTVIACYRIAHDHWQNRKALQEAKSYGMHFIDIGMKRYIEHFQPAAQLPPVEAGLQPAAVVP